MKIKLKGFSLLEVIISMLILSVLTFFILRLSLFSLQKQNNTLKVEDLTFSLKNAYFRISNSQKPEDLATTFKEQWWENRKEIKTSVWAKSISGQLVHYEIRMTSQKLKKTVSYYHRYEN